MRNQEKTFGCGISLHGVEAVSAQPEFARFHFDLTQRQTCFHLNPNVAEATSLEDSPEK